MSAERWTVSALFLTAPAATLFAMLWWRNRRENRWVRAAVARRKRHAERWS